MGLSHYFELLRRLRWLFLAMFVLGLPSVIITFAAAPAAAAAQAGGTAGYLAVLRSCPVSELPPVPGDPPHFPPFPLLAPLSGAGPVRRPRAAGRAMSRRPAARARARTRGLQASCRG